eukprot:373408-Rhodomonas_salina.1
MQETFKILATILAQFFCFAGSASSPQHSNAASFKSTLPAVPIPTAHFWEVDREVQAPFGAAHVTLAEARRAFSNCQGGLCLCTEDTYTPSCILTCFAPITCNANGRCLGETGICKCFDGWSGSNCNIPPSSTPKDTTT